MVHQFVRNVLVVILHVFLEVVKHGFILFGDEGRGHALATCATCSTYPVDVVYDVGWGMIVDNVSHTFHIETSSCHIGRNQNLIHPVLK